jgi:3-oxoacyl-[acyl-carrier-protein] synthase-1
MKTDKLVITGVGMVSSVGLTAQQSCASLNAGISRKRTMPELYYCMADDPDFEDGTVLVAATLSWLKPFRKKYPEPSKWLALIASHGFFDLMENSEYDHERFAETGLFLSLPPMLEDQCQGITSGFLYHFHNRIEKDIFPCEKVCFSGHTGVFQMIEEAKKALDEGLIAFAIVGGVESCLFPEWLEKLDQDYKIKSERNIDGYTPGEAAAFFIMEKQNTIAEKGKDMVILEGMSSTTFSGPLPAGGLHLKDVLSKLLHDKNDPPVVFCDLNGESKRMEEWGYARTSLGSMLGNPVALEIPAIDLGDVGAASGAVLIIVAMYFLCHKYEKNQSALIFTASDNGERRAIKLSHSMAYS